MDDDDVVACGGIATGRVAGQADICWTIVHRELQGHGVGNFLMTTCVAEILALERVKSARLETSQHTRGFFERWGFTAVEIAPDGFGPGLDRVEMRVELDDTARAHWQEMITGGLMPPEVEQPIPAIESYKEWSANRFNPGHYLGGRIVPHLDQLRIGPRGKRFAGLLLGIAAVQATVTLIASVAGFGTDGAFIGLAVAVFAWIAAIRMYRRGADADNR